MKSTYDSEADAFYLYLTDSETTPVADSETIADSVVFDYNEKNEIVGIEVLNASKRLPLSALKAAEQLAESVA